MPPSLCAQFLAFAQVDKRPVVEQKPPQDDDDAFDSGSDGLYVSSSELSPT